MLTSDLVEETHTDQRCPVEDVQEKLEKRSNVSSFDMFCIFFFNTPDGTFTFFQNMDNKQV